VVEGDGADGQRLLEQLEADLHDTSERADHIARSPHAVDVDHEAGGRPDGVADGLEAIEVAVDLAAACVELEPSVALALLERALDDEGGSSQELAESASPSNPRTPGGRHDVPMPTTSGPSSCSSPRLADC
jgi:hypothetical protein